MKVGDTVEYIDDWKKGRKWYLFSLYKGNLCQIVLIRDGKIMDVKNGETRLNANIVNLSTEKIRVIN
jgi:hypothetical protein